MRPVAFLERRHSWLQQQIEAEQARRHPDEARIGQLKKLKLAVKDRLLLARRQSASAELRPA
jgi:hypothetical protein